MVAKAVPEGVPVEDFLYKMPESGDEGPSLLGSRCKTCGEVYFPQTPQCKKCFTETTETIALSRVGKVYSSSIVHLAPSVYAGKVPYGVGHVELDNGVLIPTRLAGGVEKPIPIGTEVELELEVLGKDDDGNNVLVHTFSPVTG